jgi:hypothetical protein
MMVLSRRSFLQSSAATAAAAAVVPSGIRRVSAGPQSQSAGAARIVINPAIDNAKVVSCFDAGMTRASAEKAVRFTDQNDAIVADRAEANMDLMAKRLAGKNDSRAAWATIFQKPASKAWGQVKVAIKVNCINLTMMPHVPLVGKACKELIGLGVPAANITLYDACHNASGDKKYSAYVGKGLPSGVIVSNTTKDGHEVKVGSEAMKCTRVVTDCDILVNCAINKGHSQVDKGGFTLTMKNHTGTMKYGCPSLTQMIDQNKSEAIVGGTPPRQQLCIVDCLWSAIAGPFEKHSHLTNRIVMGTFGPLVDIAVAKNIREKVMGATHNAAAISTILASFGYSQGDIQWHEISPRG